jgi:FdhD protein
MLEWNHGRRRRFLDELAGEEPLEILVDGQSVSLTMRTPGHDFELAAGFLLTEGIVAQREQIARIAYARDPDDEPDGNRVEVALRNREVLPAHRLERHFFASSACGVCGRASIDGIYASNIQPADGSFVVDPEVLTRLPDALRVAAADFRTDRGTSRSRAVRRGERIRETV